MCFRESVSTPTVLGVCEEHKGIEDSLRMRVRECDKVCPELQVNICA